MQFDVTYTEKKRHVRWTLLRATLWTGLKTIPFLYVCYFVTSVLEFYLSNGVSHRPSALYMALYAGICAVVILLTASIRLPGVVARLFPEGEDQTVHWHFDDEGFLYETNVQRGYIRWVLVSKTKHTGQAFSLVLPSGVFSIPHEYLSEEQTGFIESTVRSRQKAA